jgi:hypothetical protein
MHRPQFLSIDQTFYNRAAELVDDGHGLEFAEHRVDDSGTKGDSTIRKAKGKPLNRLFEESFQAFEKERPQRSVDFLESPFGDRIDLNGEDCIYRLPKEVLDECTVEPVSSLDTRATSTVSLDREALSTLAETDDADFDRKEVVENILSSLQLSSGDPLPNSLQLPTGDLRILNAPTASGKSVLSETAALHWANQGDPTAIVVPRNVDVMETSYELDRHAEAADLDLSIVPLFSQRSHHDVLSELLEDSDAVDGNESWLMQKIGYFCELNAYADEEESPPAPGHEPCFRLTDRDAGKQQVACPFASRCPKMAMYRDATSADVIVINHHAFIAGRVPYPVDTGNGDPEQISMMELVLRRCSTVLIDEVDAFQDTVSDYRAENESLTSGDSPTQFQNVQSELRRATGRGDVDPSDWIDRVRRHLSYVTWISDEFRDLVNRGTVDWPDYQLIRGSGDATGRLAHWLFGGREDSFLDRVEDLFDDRSPVYDDDQPNPDWLQSGHRELIGALRPLVYRELDGNVNLAALRKDVIESFETWPWPESTPSQGTAPDGRTPNLKVKDDLADAIIFRGVLGSLETALNNIRVALPSLIQEGIHSAEALREILHGFATQSPSPEGPLGRRVYGFSFPRDSEGRGQLKLMTMTGDPHGDVRQIGSTISLGLAGHRRTVLGLSATARFPNAPSYDVNGELLLAQPDDGGAIDIQYEPKVKMEGSDGPAPRSISGISGGRRIREARELGKGLAQRLTAKLQELRSSPETEDRARLLLCTNSYEEAHAVCAGLQQSGAFGEEEAKAVLPEERYDDPSIPYLRPGQIESMAERDVTVLVAPLMTVARGHNILQPGSRRSAISTIYLLVRPVPPLGDAKRLLTHINYRMRDWQPDSRAAVGKRIDSERKRAEQHRRRYQSRIGPFSWLDDDLQRNVVADALVLVEQLAGRARRGETDVEVRLVDGAFEGGRVGWSDVIEKCLDHWSASGDLETMSHLHKSFIGELQAYADSATA